MGTPAGPAGFQLDRARTLVREVLLGEPRGGWLAPDATMRLLNLFGIPAVRSVQAQDTDEAVAALRELGGPVAATVVASGVLHKARAGVVPNVGTEAELLAAVAVGRPARRHRTCASLHHAPCPVAIVRTEPDGGK